jgi:hypothetical protein
MVVLFVLAGALLALSAWLFFHHCIDGDGHRRPNPRQPANKRCSPAEPQGRKRLHRPSPPSWVLSVEEHTLPHLMHSPGLMNEALTHPSMQRSLKNAALGLPPDLELATPNGNIANAACLRRAREDRRIRSSLYI